MEALGALEAALAIGDDQQQTDAAQAAAAAATANPIAGKVLHEIKRELETFHVQQEAEAGPRVLLMGAPNAGTLLKP